MNPICISKLMQNTVFLEPPSKSSWSHYKTWVDASSHLNACLFWKKEKEFLGKSISVPSSQVWVSGDSAVVLFVD